MTENPAEDASRSAPTTLPPAYSPSEVEGPLYERWVQRGYFTADANSDKPPFTIVIPPPNVTGSLHIGHAFEHTLIDALTRRARMQGFETLWLPGMDHASIAVHALVERALAAEGTNRRELGREAFVARVWEWKEQYGGAILSQMRRLGDSVDWTRQRFTMDDGLSLAVQTMFKRLYDDGLIYRAERLVNWSPDLRSVLSDAEVIHEDVEGELVSMRYGSLDDDQPHIVVATTRVETMLGDTAVAVHPDDERYAALVGTEIELPLTGRRIPIIADAHVDPAFGTGAVKVTPAHDPNDFEIGQRHRLPMLTVMDEQGRITGTATEFDGLDRFEARTAVREKLRDQGRIVAEKRPYLHSVGHSERSKEPIEPRLSLQWFVKVAPLAAAAGDAVRNGTVSISPPELDSRYFAWTDNLHDWCISRQLWWGHRIPVWYSPDGSEQVCLGPGQAPPEGWRQDEDVLDTWFSAGLWPFSTLGWPEQTPDLRKFYPTTVLVTGYDILFFWVVRMMMFGLYAMDGNQTGSEPFHTIALHGMVRDQYGKKMSKTRGNGIDPIEWMDRFGTDAVRFTFARGANPGTDVPIGEDAVGGSRNFCNKLWNATRFALINGATVSGELPAELSGADAWIVSRLNNVIAEVDRLYEAYEFAKISDLLYHFAWDEICDWYLELAKVSLAGEDTSPITRRVLGEVLDGLLRLLHPIIPFVTEALWTELTGGESVVIASWPSSDAKRIDPAAEAGIEAMQDVVLEVRRFRSDQGVKPSQRIPARLSGLAGYEAEIRTLLRLSEPGSEFAATASLVTAAGVVIELDLSTAIDVPAERTRLGRDLAAAQKEVDATAAKLGNEAFLGKAPDAVVAKIRDRHAAAQADIERITAALSSLPDA
ncbi:valine--tRNA ligase [Jatrophihabitans telluris]|uniref:Valine--tRNA ligase n=1 Tax=Jatrophihabitans telluris TaxID=2038343 RepID=A0ABY4R174_9ACTN|nr:valine--tRNA ligase [Jatrophihabitans telluris]UQX89666.1 valine--tRNA ligase [Jatrophihabitans telluris]